MYCGMLGGAGGKENDSALLVIYAQGLLDEADTCWFLPVETMTLLR
jgi:hypothetical protein